MACAETPSHSRAPGNIWVRVRVSFTTGAVSAILATAGLLVILTSGRCGAQALPVWQLELCALKG